MFRSNDIRSLTDFQRNTRDHLKRLKQTGRPEVLTVNGRAEVVVQSADSYQKLLDSAELTATVRVLRERVKSEENGQRGIPLKKFDTAMRKKHGIFRRS